MGQKKYSIENINNKKNKREKDIDKAYRKTKATTLYMTALIVFFLTTITVMASPLIFGKDYDYQTVKLNSPENVVQSLAMTVTSMELNEETGLFKIVFNYEDDTNQKSLSNLNFDYKLNFINNKGKSEAKQKVIKVDDGYAVVYYENLPEDFGVISVNIIPTYLHPELESSNDLIDKDMKFYAVEKEIKKNNNLKVSTEKELKLENFDFQKKKTEQQIADEYEKITTAKTGISMTKKDIDKLEVEIDFQTSEEQLATQTEINSLKTNIETKEYEIKESESRIKELDKKVEKIKENKKKF